ncbi:hypothetical protein ACKTEK_11080 [Tepidamorphus sp. 3E244]|uniref:hypothetical protein n=1 Tax=Tepidamorphus sp. 3E244 TaxID=3385498 RepID=UPI0038FD2ACA
MSDTSYSQRFNILARPTTYLLEDEALVWRDDAGRAGEVAYRDIRGVRLSSWPDASVGPVVYAVLTRKHGKPLKLSNRSYVSLGNFDAQHLTYTAFMKALHAKLASHGGAVNYRLGSTNAGLVATAIFSIALFVFICGTIYAVFAEGSVLGTVIAAAIMLGFVPLLVRFLLASRQRTYSPAEFTGE